MPLISFTINCPDHETAAEIADALIARRLVACANIHAPIESRYRWQGKTEKQREVPLVLKTRAPLADEVEQAVRDLHPYDVPPIMREPFTANADYEAWVRDETTQP